VTCTNPSVLSYLLTSDESHSIVWLSAALAQISLMGERTGLWAQNYFQAAFKHVIPPGTECAFLNLPEMLHQFA